MKYNYGIALLKIAACFGVVCCHYSTGEKWAQLAVPLFMAVALFLSAKGFGQGWGKIFSRLRRLYVPFLFWGFSSCIGHIVLGRSFEWQGIVFQFVVGAPLNSPLYFIMLLALYTLIIGALCESTHARKLLILLGGGGGMLFAPIYRNKPYSL